MTDERAEYNKGYEAGYASGVEDSKDALEASYNEGFDAGYTVGYTDGQGDLISEQNKTGPPEFVEPFGSEVED